MEKLFEWIRSITYYLIFITVAMNLLPNKKYEKYIRFFSGMVLILLVIKPITGGLRLDDTLAYYFESISLKKGAKELTGKVSEMEEKRLETMISSYEEAIEADLKAMAETAGFTCRKIKTDIDKDQESSTFGHVVRVSMSLMAEKAQKKDGEDSIPLVQEVEGVKINSSDWEKREENSIENKINNIGNRKGEENSRLSVLRRQIAEYYDLEEQDIEIQVEDGKG